ncbi:Retrovirus-related Pol polyprotein from transposon TNT 1-94 [Nymphaea thermarum]|nr:Retrovirus-related Pol polyprotein from transposon TNT 1-94 [Nymphaea thermarum]
MASPNSSATGDSAQDATLLNNLLPIAPGPTSLQNLLVVKLTSDNYILWENQLLPLLVSYNLKGFVDGTKTQPPQTIFSEVKEVLNPAYIEWLRLDQLLLGWIISSLSEPVHSQVVGLRSSFEVWKRLKNTYAAHSRSKVMKLREQLTILKKGTNSIGELIQKATMIGHHLSMAGKPVAEDDLVLHILSALPQEYNAFKTSIATRSDPLSLTDLYSMLLTHEAQLKEAEIDPSPTINFLNKNSSSYSPAKFNSRTNNRGGGGCYYKQNRNRVVCQYCDKPGHSAKMCFKITKLGGKQQQNHAATNKNISPPRALYAYNAGLNDAMWYPDSGASHHVTNDLNALSEHVPYEGKEREQQSQRTQVETRPGCQDRSPSAIQYPARYGPGPGRRNLLLIFFFPCPGIFVLGYARALPASSSLAATNFLHASSSSAAFLQGAGLGLRHGGPGLARPVNNRAGPGLRADPGRSRCPPELR